MIVTNTAQRSAWQDRVLPPVEQVRPGVWSIPVPIPHNPLRYTLTYAFLDDAGVLVVDPGWDTAEGRAALTAGLGRAGAALADVTGVVVTHVHPDHHGLGGWLRAGSGAWIGMHPVEAGTLPGPLGDYLGSLEVVAKFEADEALPAHEYRFRGIGDRAAELGRHHRPPAPPRRGRCGARGRRGAAALGPVAPALPSFRVLA